MTNRIGPNLSVLWNAWKRLHGGGGGGAAPSNSAPVNYSLPVISGTPYVGQTLSASTGSWGGVPTPTFAYQWQTFSGSWSNVAGATSATYVPVSALDHRVRVTATNSTSSVQAFSNPVTVTVVVTAPPAPSISSVTAGVKQVTVAGSNNGTGGATIDLYRSTATPGGAQITSATLPITHTGLSDGTSYTFTLAAHNSVGWSAESTASSSVSTFNVPGAPTIGTAVAGDTTADVAFTAPGSNGGTAITSYTATSSPGGLTGSGSSSPITVTGLTNGTAYTFTVKATNAVGQGAASAASNSVTPAVPTTVLPDNTALPSITGTTTFTRTNGTWTGTPTPTVSTQWQSYSGSAWSDISGQTASTYVSSGNGQWREKDIATNSAGTVFEVSNSIVVGASGQNVTKTFTGSNGTELNVAYTEYTYWGQGGTPSFKLNGSGAVKAGDTLGSYNVAYVNNVTLDSATAKCVVTLQGTDGNGYNGPMIYAGGTNAGNAMGLGFIAGNTDGYVSKVINGTATLYGTGTSGWTAGDTCSIEIASGAIVVKKNGTTVLTVAAGNAFITGGLPTGNKAGLMFYSSEAGDAAGVTSMTISDQGAVAAPTCSVDPSISGSGFTTEVQTVNDGTWTGVTSFERKVQRLVSGEWIDFNSLGTGNTTFTPTLAGTYSAVLIGTGAGGSLRKRSANFTVTTSGGGGGGSGFTVITGGSPSFINNVAITSAGSSWGTKPNKMQTREHPDTHAVITRYTDVATDLSGWTNQGGLVVYGRYPHTNQTAEYGLVFGENSSNCAVYRRSDGAIINALINRAGSAKGENNEVRWCYDASHPYGVMFWDGLKLYRINDVRTASPTNEPATLIKDFTSNFSGLGCTFIKNGAEGDLSLDGDYIPGMAMVPDAGGYYQAALFVYKISTDTIVWQQVAADWVGGVASVANRPNAIDVVPDGSGVVVTWNRAAGGDGSGGAYTGTHQDGPHFYPFGGGSSVRVMERWNHWGWYQAPDLSWWVVSQSQTVVDCIEACDLIGGWTFARSGSHHKIIRTLDFGGGSSSPIINLSGDASIHFGKVIGRPGWMLAYTASATGGQSGDNKVFFLKHAVDGTMVVVGPQFNQYAGNYRDETTWAMDMGGNALFSTQNWGSTSNKRDVGGIILPTNFTSGL